MVHVKHTSIAFDIIEETIALGEGYKTELRETLPSIEDIARTFCAFANTKGGTLFVGITNSGELIHNPNKYSDLNRIERATSLVSPVPEFVVEAVDKAGSNPCLPVVVGVGIGGTAERTVLMAKKALLRKVSEHNPDAEVAELEKELLGRINKLGIGPMGYGGRTTALAVNVEVLPSHIASMPAAVNLNCHSSRHKEVIL